MFDLHLVMKFFVCFESSVALARAVARSLASSISLESCHYCRGARG